MLFVKKSILPPQKGLEIPEGWRVLKDQKIKKCIEFNWNFQRGGGYHENPFCGWEEVWIFYRTKVPILFCQNANFFKLLLLVCDCCCCC